MKKTVLLCTNHLLTHETLRRPLQAANCDVVLAVNARGAAGFCERARIDLLIVDLDWPSDPGGNAVDVVRQLLDTCPRLPIIVISDRKDVSAAVELLGVMVVPERPLDVPALLRAIGELTAVPEPAAAGGCGHPSANQHRRPPNGEAFREALWRDVTGASQLANQPREWGLNE